MLANNCLLPHFAKEYELGFQNDARVILSAQPFDQSAGTCRGTKLKTHLSHLFVNFIRFKTHEQLLKQPQTMKEFLEEYEDFDPGMTTRYNETSSDSSSSSTDSEVSSNSHWLPVNQSKLRNFVTKLLA